MDVTKLEALLTERVTIQATGCGLLAADVPNPEGPLTRQDSLPTAYFDPFSA